MEDKKDIYHEKPDQAGKEKKLLTVDLTMAEARARTWRSTSAFILLMLVMLGLAVWLIFTQEQKLEDKEADLEGLSVEESLLMPPDGNDLQRMPQVVQEPESLSEPLEFEGDMPPPDIDPVKMAEAMKEMRAADGYLKAKEWDSAERHARKALDIWPEMNAALRMIGVIYTQRGQFDGAITVLERALAGNPFSAETFNNLATAYMHRGEMARAEELLLTSIDIRPDYVVGHLNLGLLYLATGQYESALDYFERALPTMPNDLTVRNNMAVCLLRLGRYDEARSHLQALIELSPETAPAYFNMAITFALEKKYDEALGWINRGAQYCSPVELQNYMADSDFDALRGHPEFQNVLRDLYPELPAGPNE